MGSPTQRTLAWYRKRDQPACVVEKWIPHTHRRLDAFGFGDILAIDSAPTLVQVTSTGNLAARVAKIADECGDDARARLASGGRIECHGWAKRVWRKKDGSKAKRKRWTLKRLEIVRWSAAADALISVEIKGEK